MAMITHCRQVEMSAAEKISLQDQYPLSDGLGNGTPAKGRWGSMMSMTVNEIPNREKL